MCLQPPHPHHHHHPPTTTTTHTHHPFRSRKKAEEYLSHLVGHEGKGSLLSALKARGWATELCAGVSDQSTATWLFDVTITLTEAGLAEGMGGWRGSRVVQGSWAAVEWCGDKAGQQPGCRWGHHRLWYASASSSAGV